MRTCVGLAILLVSMLAVQSARADDATAWKERDPIPPGYRAMKHTRDELALAGAITFGTAYALAFVVAAFGTTWPHGAGADAAGHGETYDALFAPIVGPFIQLGSAKGGPEQAIVAIDGIAQCVGATMVILAIARPRASLEPVDRGASKPEVRVHAVPVVGKTTGFGIAATF